MLQSKKGGGEKFGPLQNVQMDEAKHNYAQQSVISEPLELQMK